MAFNLTYLDRFKIEDEDLGLTEPSGLVLDHDGDGLWTVSDDTERVFLLTLDGKLRRDRTFDVPDTGLEGITMDPTGTFLFTVREETNEIIKLDAGEGKVADRRRLAHMDGYDQIADAFAGSVDNKGLEGIAWNTRTASLFVLKEGNPGLLIEVQADLTAIRGHSRLDARSGFVDPEISSREVDYSGVCYDPSRAAFWIVSDKAQRVYLYDEDAKHVTHSAPLGYGRNGKYREIKKAEGIACDPASNRLYIVSDEEARLYVFDVRP